MGDSAYQAIYTGVYVFVFIIAMSATIYLFMTIIDYAELSYNYGNTALDSNLIENIPTTKYQLLTGSDVITYYYNYVKKDKYEGSESDTKYNVEIFNSSGAKIIDETKIRDIKYDQKYKLEFMSENNNGVATIRITEVGNSSIIE